MATFTSAVVSNRTANSCTITFNAAAIDVNAAQLKALQQMINTLVIASAGNEGGNASGTFTIGAFV